MQVGAIARFVLAHKMLVGVFWLAVTIGAVVGLPAAMDQLSDDFDAPGSESGDAHIEIFATFGNGGFAPPLVPVVTLPEGTTVDTPGVREEFGAVFEEIVVTRPDARVVSWATTDDDTFVSEDRRTTFGYVFLPSAGEGVAGLAEIEATLADATVGDAPVLLSGRPALSTATDEGGTGVLIETLVGGLGALVVLLYIFGSALALLPLVIAAVSILTSFLVIGGIASFTDINFIVQFLVALIGLGIAIDYALLVVNRWREERASGLANEAAVQRAMETAGYAVLFSGTTVGIGLVALVAIPLQFFRGIGIGGMVIPLVSVIVTLTLLPVILATIGPRMDWPSTRRNRVKPDDHRGWLRWSTLVVRRRWLASGIGLGLLVLLVIPATQLAIGDPRPESLNGSGDAALGLEALEASDIGAGVMSPFEIVVHGDPADLPSMLGAIDGVRGAVAPTGDQWQRDGIALVTLVPQNDGSGAESRALVERVRNVTDGAAGNPLVGSAPAASADFIADVYGNFPVMMLLVSVLTYLFLVRAFRSLLLPLKALILNVISVAAAYGVLVLVWQEGWGSELIWGIPASGAITDWVPVMMFAFLFGLSMDYEVFILHRMREEYDRSGSTDTAIVRGLAFTGKLVTCAATILFLAFVAMAAVPETEIRIMATGLAAGIIVDATLIRAFLVPALVSLMGRWNWWLPSWLRWFAPEPHPPAARPIPAD